MKLLIAVLLLFGGLTAWTYPSIIAWKNKPTIAFENKTNAPLAKDYQIKSPFFVVTANEDELSLKMTTQSELIIYPKAKVQVPEVHNAAIAIYDIFILDGEVRVRHEGESAEQKRNQIRTVFFDLQQPKDADAVIELNMKEPSIEVRMIRGEWPLEFFAYEKKITLKAGEKVKFKGILTADGDGLKYDYLLNNKKVPQGKLGEVEKFEMSQFFEKEKKAEKSIADRKKEKQRIEAEKIRKQKAYEDSFLCKKPFGQKDQCAWWVENNKCYRKRCNVAGKWGDVTERPLNLEARCAKDFTVGECDY